MSCRYRVKKYGLASQKQIMQFVAEDLLNKKGIVVNLHNLNCLFLHNLRESTKHFIVKAILFKLLRNKRRRVACEVEINSGIVDLVDLDNLIAYEIESKPTKRKMEEKVKNYEAVKDVIFIDLRKVPNDLAKAVKFLKKFVI